MIKIMDRGAYEKLSIRDSARSLKKYGSTSRHVNKNENCVKHYVSNTDTLQGIALKYDVTIEQIRRINRLWASDSLFLKEFLLIPVSDNGTPITSPTAPTPIASPTQTTSSISDSFDEENVEDFLGKIDAAIANTKKEVRKTQHNSEFVSNTEHGMETKRKGPVSRMKKNVNNNGDPFTAPQAVVVQQGRRVKSSLLQHEQQQEQLFEL